MFHLVVAFTSGIAVSSCILRYIFSIVFFSVFFYWDIEREDLEYFPQVWKQIGGNSDGGKS